MRFPSIVLMVLLLSACGGNSAQRTTYETLQNVGRQECERSPSADCPPRESFDDYQRRRRELESK